MFRILLTIISLVVPITMSAQWGKTTNVRIEHNVKTDNGRTMLQVHFNMEAHHANGHQIKTMLFIDCPAGTPHHWVNGQNMVQEGNHYISNYEDCYWNGDQWIGIYNDCLNPKPDKNIYYARIGIWDVTLNRWLNDWDNTPFVSYEMTGSAPAQTPYYNVQPYIPATPQQNLCGVCGGTGRCSICGGTGLSPNHASGIRANCGGCGGTGICPTCSGRGWN